MPGLARKILIFAAVDGLVLQPLSQRGQRPAPTVNIAYKDSDIRPVLKDGGQVESIGKSFETFGIVGLLTVSTSSFLISITRRQQVAQIRGKPIYVITEVALTPLSSRAEADASIAHTKSVIQRRELDDHGLDSSDTEGDEGEFSAAVSDDVDDEDTAHATVPSQPASSGEHKRTSSVAEDVITRKGGYGRFAQKWFSRKGWTVDQRRNLGMTVSDPGIQTLTSGANKSESARQEVSKSDPSTKDQSENSTRPQKANDVAANLLPKLLRTAQVLFGTSRSFYFSYDYDITRSFMDSRTTNPDLPLHKQVDLLFFWNRNIILPFIDAGQTSLVLPLMQGFVGQREFEMDPDPPKPIIGLDGAEKSSMELVDMSPNVEDDARDSNARISSECKHQMKPHLLTLISRRSVKRAGLRYLRRGVDEEGNTANGVETEQILSDPFWTSSSKIHSFVQIRGSIPIFFSQSPYSFKPVPQIQHSEETNHRAFVEHFRNISDRYGAVQVTSLVEKHGNEAIVGDEYEKHINHLNNEGGVGGCSIGFEWFDFHAICKGMKFENVSLLMESLGKKLDSFGDTVEADGQQLSKQSGVLRTNCMDCLDRTNVVQSACGRRALELQLKDEGIDMGLQVDQNTSWFNGLWADNGDAISKQYASTAALKGDFTRTRKRDYRGALTDMGLSISRFYSGIVNDYFSQAAIDFFLGNVTSVVFEDFEANLMSVDPAVSMQKMRQQAIETCQKQVIADDHEEFIGGWTLLTPQIPNTIKSTPFEETVLLLTATGLYSCRFDWNMEKVSSFERIDLQHVEKIKYGTYITSTLSAAQSDDQRNTGMVITYKPGSDDITRVNTRSISSLQSRNETDLLGGTSTNPTMGKGKDSTNDTGLLANLLGRPSGPDNRVLALKALPSRSAVVEGTNSQLSEVEQVKAICSEIERMISHGRVVEAGTERKSLVESSDIISLADAKKSTGLLEQIGHSIKMLVWA